MSQSFFSRNLRNSRKFHKISLETLALEIGVSKSAISDYENDKFSPPLSIVKKLVDYFGSTIDAFEYSQLYIQNSEGSLSKTPNSITDGNYANLLEKIKNLESTDEKYKTESRLTNQKIESLQIQIKLNDQLKASKLSEIELLKTQIKLLEDKISLLA